jgi:TonB-dependent receptor
MRISPMFSGQFKNLGVDMGVRNPSIALPARGVAAGVRNALRGTISVTVGSCLLAASAHGAESTAASSGAQVVEEVIVTGIRQSLESAQEIKQEAEQIVDSVTAQDIGALPDRSVSEALQRIPGITLQRTNENRDPARLASEGGGVFIRGLSWVRSETNGRDVFSANNGRNLSFEDVSADLLSGINVYKNPSADMIEGGIGGTVDLRTRLPFDSPERLLAFSADYNYADLKDEGFASGNALYSDSWDTNAGRFGLLLSYSIGNIGNRTDSVQTGRFEAQTVSDTDAARLGVPAGSTVYVPNAIGWRRIDWEQERTAMAGALQWAPNDQLTFTVQALRAEADPQDVEYAFGDTDGGFTGKLVAPTFDDRGVVTSGTIGDVHPTADTRFGESHKRTSDYSLNMKFVANDNWAFSGDVQYIESEADVLSMTAFTQLAPQYVTDGSGNTSAVYGTLDFDLNGNTPRLALNNDRQGNQDAYWWAAAMDHIEDNEANEVAVRADAEYTFDDSPWLRSFRFGVRGTDKDSTTRQSGWNWGYLSQQFWCQGCGDPAYLNEGSSSLVSSSQLMNYDDFFRGDVRLPGIGWFPTPSLVSGGTQNAFDLLRDTQGAGWGWAPLTDEVYENQLPGGDNVTGGINDQGEKTTAGYFVVRFGMDESAVGRFDGNIGARWVKTETDAAGLALTVAPLQGNDPAGCAAAAAAAAADPAIPDLDCTAFNAAYAFGQGGDSLPPVDSSNSYTDVLPTLNLRFFLADDVQLRFAAGKAIARPSFSQMVPYTTLGFEFDNAYYPNSQGWATGSGGNPQLKPTRSTQFDTSLEWYFAPGGSLTGAYFYKDIKDYIFIGNEEESYTSGGETVSFLVSRNMNGSSGKVQGFELAYQQFYDNLPGFLSGFGLQANFTYVDSSGGKNTAVNILEPAQVDGAADEELPLEGLSKTSYNVALMYEKYGVSARLAYNWREEYLLTTSAANIQRPVWMEDYGQLDGSVFYSLTDNVKIGVQGTNLLNTRTFMEVGGVSLSPRYSWTDTDRRIAVAIRTSF